ncbi:hypothetical protein CCR95_21315 [Thiocystis minor]|uniref:glycosyltransferase family 2 protein n=1 Tax=Thiocystis minor TaxID=61597 RepID=UPI0019135F96|nr:glycosyltransferase [Thiocystis minor]MBK5966543.1 hypothetical protein [Thiocystis minor]
MSQVSEIRTHPGLERPINPLISVCIANYNGSKYIEQCIQSVITQDVSCNIEIIVHDDASTDDSIALIALRFPNVKIVASKTNVGFCISNNRMVLRSHGEYILLLNNDAVLRPHSLQKLFKHAETVEQPRILSLPQYSITDGNLVDRGYDFDLFMNPVPLFMQGIQDVSTVTGACLWIPRIIWDDVGGFPEWFESVAEDIFICQAARLLGYSVTMLDSPGFDHWIGRNLGGGKLMNGRLASTARRRALSERNKTFVIMMCYPALLVAVMLPLHFGFLAAEAAALLVSGVSLRNIKLIYFSLPTSLLRNIRDVIAVRQRIQSKRRAKFSSYLRRFRWIPWKLRMLFVYGIPKLH